MDRNSLEFGAATVLRAERAKFKRGARNTEGTL
jgi:hypothetical protein